MKLILTCIFGFLWCMAWTGIEGYMLIHSTSWTWMLHLVAVMLQSGACIFFFFEIPEAISLRDELMFWTRIRIELEGKK